MLTSNPVQTPVVKDLRDHLPLELYQRVLERYALNPEQAINAPAQLLDVKVNICASSEIYREYTLAKEKKMPFTRVFADSILAIVLKDKSKELYKKQEDLDSEKYESWKNETRFSNREFIDIIQALLKVGANPNLRIPLQAYPITLADHETFPLLMKAGADLSQPRTKECSIDEETYNYHDGEYHNFEHYRATLLNKLLHMSVKDPHSYNPERQEERCVDKLLSFGFCNQSIDQMRREIDECVYPHVQDRISLRPHSLFSQIVSFAYKAQLSRSCDLPTFLKLARDSVPLEGYDLTADIDEEIKRGRKVDEFAMWESNLSALVKDYASVPPIFNSIDKTSLEWDCHESKEDCEKQRIEFWTKLLAIGKKLVEKPRLLRAKRMADRGNVPISAANASIVSAGSSSSHASSANRSLVTTNAGTLSSASMSALSLDDADLTNLDSQASSSALAFSATGVMVSSGSQGACSAGPSGARVADLASGAVSSVSNASASATSQVVSNNERDVRPKALLGKRRFDTIDS